MSWEKTSHRMTPPVFFLTYLILGITWTTYTTGHARAGEATLELPRVPYSTTLELPLPTAPGQGETVALFEGLLDFLGRGEIEAPFCNPALLGNVEVVTSPLDAQSGPSHSVADRSVTTHVLTQPQESAWIELRLKEGAFTPTSYRLVQPDSLDQPLLRNWVMEAGNDGLNWTQLRQHVNDNT